MDAPRVLPAGDRAVLVEVGDTHQALAVAAAIRGRDGIEDVVPGHRTVLVTWEPGRRAPTVDWAALVRERSDDVVPDELALPVCYDGADLAHVAELTGLSPEAVVARHRSAEYLVAFVGFAPGFAYLTGGDPVLAVPRRAEPRTKVPAGSVALGGPYTAVYPGESPGGWQLIGRTTAVMFDPRREPPALLRPGMRVRIEETA